MKQASTKQLTKNFSSTFQKNQSSDTACLSNPDYPLSLLDAAMPVGTVLFRPEDDGKLLHVGGTLLADLGYTPEDYAAFQENHLRGFVYEEDYGTAFSDQRTLADAPVQDFEQEYRVVAKDGSIAWLYEKGTLVQLDGAPAYIIICVDITKRKEIEDRLRISEEEMSVAMAQMGKMVCLYDVPTRTLTIPESFAAMHGLPAILTNTPENIINCKILSQQGRVAFQDLFRAILRGEKTGSFEICMHHADQTERWEHAEFVTIFCADNRPVKAIISVEDVTQQHLQKDENDALRESESIFRAVAAHSNRLIYRYDIAEKTAYADSVAAARAYAAPVYTNLPEEVITNGYVLPESIDDFRRIYREINDGKPEGSIKLHTRGCDGNTRWSDMRYSLVDARTAVISFQDITDTHERELAYERYHQIVANESSENRKVYFETDLSADNVGTQDGNIPGLEFPPSGSSHDDTVRYGIEHMLPVEVHAQAWAFFSREHLLTAFADGKRSFSQDLPVILPSGERCWFRADIQMIQDPYSGHILVYTGLHDVTREVTAALDVKKQAETDGMTGVYNKTTTEALIKERLAGTSGARCILLIADLDNLKSINDRYGHAQGDRAICQMAEALRKQFRHTDIVGRIGGDEFLVFLDSIGNEAVLRSSMVSLMRKFSTLRIGESNDVILHGSIGVVFGTAGEDSFTDLSRKADRALYHVKQNGKNYYAVYTPEMENTAYRFKGHNAAALWQTDVFDRKEIDRLLYAVSEIYPLVIFVNLTQNSYYMMQYNHYMTRNVYDTGAFDDLVEGSINTFYPDDRASFAAMYSREHLLAAHARGERVVSHIGRQLGDDGIYRQIRTDVIFTQNDGGDVRQITLARALSDDATAFTQKGDPHV